MALKAIVEVLVHLDSFRNVDLTKQGLYQIRISISAEKQPHTCAAPYELLTLGFHNRSACLLPARIDDQTNAMCSSTVLIRYCDEEIKMSDACVFRIELDRSAESELTIEAQLLFTDFEGTLNFDTPLSQLIARAREIAFTHIDSARLQVLNPLEGVHHYSQFVFPNPHMCVLAVTLHISLMDYRFRITSPLSDLELPKAIAKCLFSREDGTMKPYIGSDETDKKYSHLVSDFSRSHTQLRQFISMVLKKCVSQDLSSAFGDTPESLNLPLYRSLQSDSQPEKFSEAVASHDPVFVSAALMSEISLIAGHVFQLLHVVKSLLRTLPSPIVVLLREQYFEEIRERCGESVFRDSHIIHSCPLTADNELADRHRLQAVSKRNSRYFRHLAPMPIHDQGLFSLPDAHPILFEDNYIHPGPFPRPENKPIITTDHVMVLVHGYQGNPFDMRLIRNSLGLVYPQALFLCSVANEEGTEGDIVEMGRKLAREVCEFVEEWCPGGKMAKLSFIAHSLGGLIVRAALPHLLEYSSKMYSFISLSSPHLGYMYTASRLVDAGMWLLKAWSKALCLKQLSMTDHSDPYQTALYHLSGFPGLSCFKHVVLIASHQDQYAPFESVRVEVSPRAVTDPVHGRAYVEMATRMLGSLSPSQVCRLDVSFKIGAKSLDSLIGRKAHIEFLENEGFLRLLAFRYPEFFR